MPTLAILVTGQVRTFFKKEVFLSFLNMLNRCLYNYEKVYLFFIINETYNKEQFGYFFNIHNTITKIVEFDSKITDELTAIKLNSPLFKEVEDRYLHNNLDIRLNLELPSPTAHVRKTSQQPHQIKVGIEEIEKLEEQPDVIMRTRFDSIYNPEFYPIIHKEIELPREKILFSDIIKKYNNVENIEEHIELLKKQVLPKTNARIRDNFYNNSFGGRYMYNWVALENIVNGSDDILYCLNDHVLFAKSDVFKKIKYFFDEYGLLETDLDIHHTYAHECQLLIFCFRNNINPLMFFNNNLHFQIK